MMKKTVTYTDYNDKSHTETFWFHATKAELMEELDIRQELENLQARLMSLNPEGLSQKDANIPQEEMLKILRLVKRLIDISYGVRSGEAGEKFRKSADILEDFKSSAAYDAVLFAIFTSVETAVEFMTGIFPKDVMEEAKARGEGIKMPQDHQPKHSAEPTTGIESVPFDDSQVETTAPEKSREELEAELAALRAQVQN